MLLYFLCPCVHEKKLKNNYLPEIDVIWCEYTLELISDTWPRATFDLERYFRIFYRIENSILLYYAFVCNHTAM